LIEKIYQAKSRENIRYEKLIKATSDIDNVDLSEFSRRKAQLRLIELLKIKPDWPMTELKQKNISADTIKKIEAEGLLKVYKIRQYRDSYADIVNEKKEIELSTEQKQAVNTLSPLLRENKFQGVLLHGVTGSGKTQVYIEAAAIVRSMKRKVIVLVPEIALTGQVVSNFKTYFADDIVVIHSRLSMAERNDAIMKLRLNKAGIVIGARSALFTPLDNVGLIILDEEQDMSYKQDEAPRYHAKIVAEQLAKIHGAVLLLGSATPSVETAYRASNGELKLIRLTKRIGETPLPKTLCVDMKEELRLGNRNIVSRSLEKLIKDTIEAKEQLIIMLNRRGFSTFVMCRSCGAVIKCKDCGMPLVYHKNGKLQCHHCDISEPVPSICPVCGSRYIKYFGSGTEKLETELRNLVPYARIVRMDRDTTGKKFSPSRNIGQVSSS